MTICKHVTYSGHVQGVGFRYTAQGLAARYPVAGYVRNLPGGDVELVAEGPADEVEAFLGALARRMADCIERTTVRDEAPAGHQGFHIRH
jgi:acylphosphatase